MENWRFIEENPDYMISDHGRVLSFKGKSKLILYTKIIGTGYETVSLLKESSKNISWITSSSEITIFIQMRSFPILAGIQIR